MTTHLLLLQDATAATVEAYAKLDRSVQLNLVDTALRLARQTGEAYADIRIGRNEHEFAFAREDRLEHINAGLSLGFSVRVLLNDCRGFAASETKL